jgi:hypothetical protein
MQCKVCGIQCMGIDAIGGERIVRGKWVCGEEGSSLAPSSDPKP